MKLMLTLRSITVCALTVLFFASASYAQRATTQSTAISKADGFTLGRANGANAMFVQHRLDYCLTGTSGANADVFRVVFETKNINAKSDKKLIRGQFFAVQEPLNSKTPRCGSLDFEVHADAVLSVAPFAAESAPKLSIVSSGGQKITTRAVTIGR